MMNFRFREKTNTWPAFVDLFSNLVIILIFLLIVFVFLWTTTSVFNRDTGAKTVADLRKTNAAQAEKIVQMTADEEEAKRLLVLARTELENLTANNNLLSNELAQVDTSINELIAQYESKVAFGFYEIFITQCILDCLVKCGLILGNLVQFGDFVGQSLVQAC